MKLSQLKKNPDNPRLIRDANFERLKKSIAEFGAVMMPLRPIVYDENNVVLGGNMRLAACKALGMKDVPDDWVKAAKDLTDEQKREFVIKDNATGFGENDWDALANSWSDLPLSDWGVDIPADWAGEENDAPDACDGVPDDAPTRCKAGQLWRLGEHRLLCGDSTKAADVARLMDGEKAALCFTSPPYNLGASVGLRNGARKGAASAYNDMEDNAEWSALMRGFLVNALGVCRVACINVQLLSGNKVDLLTLFGEYAKKTIDIAVWVKTNPQPAMAEGVMSSAFEFLWLLTSSDMPTRRIETATFNRGCLSNVIESGTASGHDASVHGAVFPVALAVNVVESISAKQDIVYEPFLGSGTTLIAAEQTARKCFGVEISEKYCDVVLARWEAFTGKTAELITDGNEAS